MWHISNLLGVRHQAQDTWRPTCSKAACLYDIHCLQAFLPLLGADSALQGPPGRIIMVSSVAGKFAAPFIGGYAASKHGLEGMSASLRRELMLYGIDVIIIGGLKLTCMLSAAVAAPPLGSNIHILVKCVISSLSASQNSLEHRSVPVGLESAAHTHSLCSAAGVAPLPRAHLLRCGDYA